MRDQGARKQGIRAAILSAAAALLCLAPASASATPVDNFPGQTVDPSGVWADSGSGFGLTGELNEPNHDGSPTPITSAWYSWTPTVDTTVTIETCSFTSPGEDTLIAVYTGSTVDLLTAVPGAINEDACGLRSRVRLSGVGGTTYRIAVDTKGSPGGTWAFYMNPTPANDDLVAAQVLPGTAFDSVPGTTTGATRETPEPLHAGVAGGTSVWYAWTPPASGRAVFQTCGSDPGSIDTLLSVYDGGQAYGSLNPIGENDDGCGQQSTVTIPTVTPLATYFIAVEGKQDALNPGGAKGGFQLEVAMPPDNDNFVAREVFPMGSLPLTFTGNNIAAGDELDEALVLGGPGRSIWHEWTPTVSGPVSFSTCDSGSTATQIDIYTGTAPPFTGLSLVGTDNSSCPSGFQGKKTVNVTAGTPYVIRVSSAGAGGPIEIDLEDASSPPPPGGGTTSVTPVTTPVAPASSTVVTTTKKCKKGRKLKRGKCVKKKRK